MSLYNELKAEILDIKLPPCCRKAFLAGVIRGTGTLVLEGGTWNLCLEHSGLELIERCIEHINSIIKISPEVYKKVRSGGLQNRTLYGVKLSSEEGQKLLSALKIDSPVSFINHADIDSLSKPCCIVSYIRGLFLSSGSMVVEERGDDVASTRTKGYYLEIVVSDEELANILLNIFAKANLDAKVRAKKNSCSVYFKGGEPLSDFLAYIGTTKTYFALQEILIERSVNNHINRQQNFESANLDRAMNAANKQHDAVLLIDRVIGISSLDENLRSVAKARLDNPLTPLQDLSEHIHNAPGKSGLRHRMDKILQIAASLQEKN